MFNKLLILHVLLLEEFYRVVNELNTLLLEYKFLKQHKYITSNLSENINSTPYNRVDHVFALKKMQTNQLLKWNYSDHLPLFPNLE